MSPFDTTPEPETARGANDRNRNQTAYTQQESVRNARVTRRGERADGDRERSHPTTSERYTAKQRERETGEQILGQRGKRPKRRFRDTIRGFMQEEGADQQQARQKLRRREKQELSGRIQNMRTEGKDALLKKVSAKLTFRAILWGTYYLGALQLAFFILYMIALGILVTPLLELVLPEGVTSTLRAFMSTLSLNPDKFSYLVLAGLLVVPGGLPFAIPVAIDTLLKESGVIGGIFLALYSVTILIGLTGVAFTWLLYKMNPAGIHPLGGGHSGGKWLFFIGAVLFLVMPFTNFAPWYLIWAWYVKKHPA